jgi:hypothetical protein
MPVEIKITGLDKIYLLFADMPNKMRKFLRTGMEQSLLVLHENVPPYPPNPVSSKYIRTGMLGKSLGSSEAGGKVGTPTVYSVKSNDVQTIGQFGTQLSYAKYVIDPDRQAYMHKGRWWTMNTIKVKSEKKVIQVWERLVKGVLSVK